MLKAVEVTAHLTFGKISRIVAARDAVLAEVQQHEEFRRPDQLVQKIFTQPITRIRHLTGDRTYAINTARAYLDRLAGLQVLEKQTTQGQYYYLNRELYTILAD